MWISFFVHLFFINTTTSQAAYKPLKLIIIPLRFLLERIVVVSCLNLEAKKATTERLNSSQQSQRFRAASSRRNGFSTKAGGGGKSQKNALLVPRNSSGGGDEEDEDEIGFSSKRRSSPKQLQINNNDDDNTGATEDRAPMSYTEKIQASGGLTKKNKAVSFRSTKIALDENYMDELDKEQAEFSFSTKIMEYTAK